MHRIQPAQARRGVDWVTLDEAAPSPDEPRSLYIARPIRVAVSHHDTADSGGPSRHRSTPVNERGRSRSDDIEGFTPNERQRDDREGRMTAGVSQAPHARGPCRNRSISLHPSVHLLNSF